MSRAISTDDVDLRRQVFRANLIKGLVYASGAVALAFTTGVTFSSGWLQGLFPLGSLIVSVACLGLLRRGRVALAARGVLYADMVLVSFSGWIEPNLFINAGGAQLLAVLVSAFTLLEGRRQGLPFLLVACVGMTGTDVKLGLFTQDLGAAWAGLVLKWVAATVAWVVASAFFRYQQKNEEAGRRQVTELSRIVEASECIASGDLGGALPDGERAAAIIGRLQAGLRGLVQGLKDGVSVLGETSLRLGAMSQEHERGASKQAAAVTQVLQVVEGMAVGSRRIEGNARDVVQNAEATLDTSRAAADRLDTLTNHAGRVTELLESITEIASRSELLALNAGLEGVRAGVAGRGFSLVAAELQRLSEATKRLVENAQRVVQDMQESSSVTVAAVGEATELARGTAEVARGIADITQNQRRSAEELAGTMAEIQAVASQSVDTSRDTREAMDAMRGVSVQLKTAAGAFRT